MQNSLNLNRSFSDSSSSSVGEMSRTNDSKKARSSRAPGPPNIRAENVDIRVEDDSHQRRLLRRYSSERRSTSASFAIPMDLPLVRVRLSRLFISCHIAPQRFPEEFAHGAMLVFSD